MTFLMRVIFLWITSAREPGIYILETASQTDDKLKKLKKFSTGGVRRKSIDHNTAPKCLFEYRFKSLIIRIIVLFTF